MDCRICSGIGVVYDGAVSSLYSEWVKCMTCLTCMPMQTWFICGICERKTHFVSTKQLGQHHYRSHSNKKSKKSKLLSAETNGDNFINPDPELEECCVSKVMDLSILRRAESRKFIQYERNGNGAKYLVARSCNQFDLDDTSVNEDEVVLHLRLAQFCMSLSRNEREKFAVILKTVVEFTKCKHLSNSKLYNRTEIPVSVEKFRSTYATGEHSILNNLPHPLVYEMKDHAYVSLCEIIQHFLAIHTQMIKRENRFTKNFTNICSRAKTVHPFSRLYVVAEIVEWSDDFDPNYLKSNRGSVWIKTVTLRSLLVRDNVCLHETAREQTFAVALGPKGESHDPVEHKFSRELQILISESSNYFNGLEQCMVPVYAELSLSLQDQPERRSANYLLGGNSTMHGRWGYSADIFALASVLPPCQQCWEVLKERGIEARNICCKNCTNWSMDVNSPLLDFAPPHEYPKEELSASMALRPKQITYSELISAITKARQKLENGEWSYNNAEAYLGFFCLTKSAISELLDAALMRRQHNENVDIEIQSEDLMNDYPEYFVDKPLPPLWTRHSILSNHVDVPMHLMFLGVVKATITIIKDWIKVRGHGQSYQTYSNQALCDIPFIQWCNINSFSGEKLGGWVSENYLAFSRVMKWFYCNCSDMFAEKNPYSDPPGDARKWPKPLCLKWLEARGVDLEMFVESNTELPDMLLCEIQQLRIEKKKLSNTPVFILRKIIAFYLGGNPEAMPQLISDGLCGIQDIQYLVKHLSGMVSAIMTCNGAENGIEEVEYEIKMFLATVDRIDKSMKRTGSNSKKRWKPIWISKYNFICLLNIPCVIRNYGPIRNVWEGSNQGEGYIRRIKPELSSGLRKNWQISKMTKLLQQDSLSMLMNNNGIQNRLTEERRQMESNFHVYSSLLTAHRTKDKNKPLSGVMFNDNQFGIILFGNRLIEMIPDKSNTCFKQLCQYEHWSLSFEAQDVSELNIISYVLFLPLIENTQRTNETNNFYTVVYSTWNDP